MKFRVLTSIRMNRREYRPGEEIELTEEQAGKMPWAVEDPRVTEGKKQDAAPLPSQEPRIVVEDTGELPVFRATITSGKEPMNIFLESQKIEEEPAESEEEPEPEQDPPKDKGGKRGKRGRK